MNLAPSWTSATALVLVAGLFLAACPAAANEGAISFTYSPLTGPSCKTLRNDEEGGGQTDRCKGFAGLDIEINSGDHSDILSVVRGGRTLVNGPNEYNTTVRRKVVEWRYRGSPSTPTVTALILRMDTHGERKSKSRLFVLRLTGRACLLGSAHSNEAARKLADDLGRACP